MTRSFTVLQTEAWAIARFATRHVLPTSKYDTQPQVQASGLWVASDRDDPYDCCERVCLEHGVDSFVHLFLQNATNSRMPANPIPDDRVSVLRGLVYRVFRDLAHCSLQDRPCCNLLLRRENPQEQIAMNDEQVDALWCAHSYFTLAILARHVHSVSMYKLFVDQFRRLWARVLHALETGEDAPGLAKK
ncbi:hypothetical protein HRG_014228 [Hirsutella rhossiliensis]